MIDAVLDAPRAEALRAYLQETFCASQLAYAEPPSRLQGGFETHIFAFRLRGAPAPSSPLILRLFPPSAMEEQVKFEAVVHAVVAQQGLPAPGVHTVCTDPAVLGGFFLVLDLLPGATMVDNVDSVWRLLLQVPGLLVRMPRLLAELQLQLHVLEPALITTAAAQAGLTPAAYDVQRVTGNIRMLVEEANLEAFRPCVQWLDDHRPASVRAPVICHGDFHPLNLLMENERVTGMLDWGNTKVGPREYDIGATIQSLQFGPLDVPDLLYPASDRLRAWLVESYVRAYEAQQPIDRTAVAYYTTLISVYELAQAAYDRVMYADGRPQDVRPPPYSGPREVRALSRHIAAATGLPPPAFAPLPANHPDC